MTGFLAGSVVQALVAALFVSAYLRLLGVRSPSERFRFRLLALAVPLVVHPAAALLPYRRDEDFLRDRALFWAGRWEAAGPTGARLLAAAVAAMAALSLALLVRDLLAARRRRPPPAAWGTPPPALRARVDTLASLVGVPAPLLLISDSQEPSLLCRGLARPRLVVSQGALAGLDDRALTGALAHELAHLKGSDLLWGWGLLAARLLLAWNPVVQVLGRKALHDLEERADAVSARASSPGSVAAALERLSPRHALDGSPLEDAGSLAIQKRRSRLLDGSGSSPAPGGGLRLGAAAVALLVLLAFVA